MLLEDLICDLFERVPGITLTKRNALNVFSSEEVDVAFWNRQDADGFYFLPHIILVECKNWSRPVGSEEVNWFDSKIGRRGQPFGILVAANGITGEANEVSAAHEIVRAALAGGRRLVVITRSEIEGLRTTDQLVRLVQEKLCELVVSGTLFL
jgi:Restriction endonuclease